MRPIADSPAVQVLVVLALLAMAGPTQRSVVGALGSGQRTSQPSLPQRLLTAVRGKIGESRQSRSAQSQVRLLISQVTALLRSGAPPAAAWTRAAGVPVDGLGVPSLAALTEVIGARSALAVVGATRLAMTVGAPLAPALNAVCEALAAEAEAEGERATALAGPRTTARVLMALPFVGLGLGWLLGADPLATALDGGVGTASVALGLAAMAGGRIWINRLVASAKRVGEEAA